MRIVYIMRGIPGSSRNEIANTLFRSLQCAIVSIDDWFVKNNSGKFDVVQLPTASRDVWTEYKKTIDENIDIIVNNVNSKHRHFNHYIEYARRNGYEIAIINIQHPDINEASKKSKIDIKYIRKIMLEWER